MVKMPHWPIPYGKSVIDLELWRIKALLSKLGEPQKKIPHVIHVAGTNGKGSTIAYLKAIFESAGYSVHRYTSPHLVRFNERIVIAGKEIEDEFLYQIAEECRFAAGDLELTFFEGTTAMAFLAFSKIEADVVLLEVGLGGRLDATNVIESPLLSVITPISIDHTEYLGYDLCQIASEKAGIIKQGSLCTVIGWQEERVLELLHNCCMLRQVPSFVCRQNWNFQKTANGFLFITHDNILELPNPSLQGIHQIMNAACAVAAVQQLSNIYTISIENIRNGIENTSWPARMQLVQSGVLHSLIPQGSELWVDGAHNVGGAQMLALSIAQLDEQDKLLYLINGRTKQRDIEGFLAPFLGCVEMLCAVKVISEPLSESAKNIALVSEKMGFRAKECEGLRHAIDLITKDAGNRNFRILVCGSLYLAADLLAENVI